MGNAFSNCICKKHRIGSVREITLLMIGLDNAGKTCTVKHLLGEPTADAVPTIGFSSISLKHGKYTVTIYDLGGGPKIRGIWKKYYALVHGLIFVVDASDSQRLEECKKEIQSVLTHDKIAGKPMLMLVNKQDVSGAIDETELVSRLDLEVLVNQQKCPTRVEASCALYDEAKMKDPGIQEGFNWLIGIISRDFNELNKRVEEEVNEQKKEEEKEQLERMKRVQKIREEREREATKNAVNGEKDGGDDDDDDVIIGNPFKSCDVIKAEFEEKEKSKTLQATTPTVKVIHVSPTNSAEANNREEVILLPQPLNEKVQSLPSTMESPHSISSPEQCNGGGISPFICEDEEVKKKSKKIKKRFKNRIVPEIHDTNNISHISRLNELPPIKPAMENATNGQPCVYMSPKRFSQQNGKINWALAEELEPCRATSLAGCSSRRIEAWSDESYSPI
ncbi:ADP-ribosylation factor-like protein 13B [Argiope bruennichi]|uniref:ADP-ribosylation factor-like protein 13B n=1 Tax=Argiope bruennichi TaxID=94029 RepID=UPI0024940791|nr:ADP-ribosylation factor-like protein 13B [Argiope bruennichi]